MENLYDMGAPQGWQCPICKRVYSPTTPMCWYCGGEAKAGTTTQIETDWTHKENESIEQFLRQEMFNNLKRGEHDVRTE